MIDHPVHCDDLGQGPPVVLVHGVAFGPAAFRSVADAPAISVPCGVTSDGLPVGLQVVAPPGREDVVVALGAAVERTSPIARFASLTAWGGD